MGGQHDSLHNPGDQSGGAVALGVNLSLGTPRLLGGEKGTVLVYLRKLCEKIGHLGLLVKEVYISEHLQFLLLFVSKPINDKGSANCLQRT